MYIAEYNNNCIRKVTVSTGIITTIAGTGGTGTGGYNGDNIQATAAKLSYPSGVMADSAGKSTVFMAVILGIYALSN